MARRRFMLFISVCFAAVFHLFPYSVWLFPFIPAGGADRKFFLAFHFPLPLILKTAAADKFAQDRRRGYLVGGDGDEVVEELEQSLGLGILDMRVGHLAQDGLHLGAQYRYLVEERRVEYCVGILLIGEYVLLLAAADAGPALQRREGVVAARIVVARDAAQQAVVRGGCR